MSVVGASSTMITNRQILNAVAIPPALKMPMTRSFFIRDMCSDHSIGTGRMRIHRSLTILMAESAMMTFCWSIQVPPSLVPYQYAEMGLQKNIFINKAGI